MNEEQGVIPTNFYVTDYLQRLETFATAGQTIGADVRAAVRSAELYAAAVLVPVCGNAVQRPGTRGFDPDGFMRQHGTFRFRAIADLETAALSGWLPQHHPQAVTVSAACAGFSNSMVAQPDSPFFLILPLAIARGREEEFTITLSGVFVPSHLPGGSTDSRGLGCIMRSIAFA